MNGPPPNGSGFSFMLAALNPACCVPADSPIPALVPTAGYESRLRCSTLPDYTGCIDVSSVSPTSACGGSRRDFQASSSLATLRSRSRGSTTIVKWMHSRHARHVGPVYGSNRYRSVTASIRNHQPRPVRWADSSLALGRIQRATLKRVTPQHPSRQCRIGQSVAVAADWPELRRSDMVWP